MEGTKQNAWRFVTLLAKRYHPYPKARVIPVILDNDRIHTGVQAAWALAQAEGRMELHFLPPYSPEANQLERVGEDLPANVTRNPTCPDLATLMREVRPYLQKRDRRGLQDNVNEAA